MKPAALKLLEHCENCGDKALRLYPVNRLLEAPLPPRHICIKSCGRRLHILKVCARCLGPRPDDRREVVA